MFLGMPCPHCDQTPKNSSDFPFLQGMFLVLRRVVSLSGNGEGGLVGAITGEGRKTLFHGANGFQ